ncbi:uncharacterized protein JCM6883_000571 [Sporobolomyces salmoneus]|uniref:uncharacterized protein n=1 Tax=Sporobolomyces salmoneus TaxID=183962 RepID=UPI00316FFAE4
MDQDARPDWRSANAVPHPELTAPRRRGVDDDGQEVAELRSEQKRAKEEWDDKKSRLHLGLQLLDVQRDPQDRKELEERWEALEEQVESAEKSYTDATRRLNAALESQDAFQPSTLRYGGGQPLTPLLAGHSYHPDQHWTFVAHSRPQGISAANTSLIRDTRQVFPAASTANLDSYGLPLLSPARRHEVPQVSGLNPHLGPFASNSSAPPFPQQYPAQAISGSQYQNQYVDPIASAANHHHHDTGYHHPGYNPLVAPLTMPFSRMNQQSPFVAQARPENSQATTLVSSRPAFSEARREKKRLVLSRNATAEEARQFRDEINRLVAEKEEVEGGSRGDIRRADQIRSTLLHARRRLKEWEEKNDSSLNHPVSPIPTAHDDETDSSLHQSHQAEVEELEQNIADLRNERTRMKEKHGSTSAEYNQANAHINRANAKLKALLLSEGQESDGRVTVGHRNTARPPKPPKPTPQPRRPRPLPPPPQDKPGVLGRNADREKALRYREWMDEVKRDRDSKKKSEDPKRYNRLNVKYHHANQVLAQWETDHEKLPERSEVEE